jgi:hypothetical protein
VGSERREQEAYGMTLDQAADIARRTFLDAAFAVGGTDWYSDLMLGLATVAVGLLLGAFVAMALARR